MSDWIFPHSEQAEELAQLHFFSIKKRHAHGAVEIHICVKEFALRNAQGMKFFAQTEEPLNQDAVPFQPFGWGETLSEALSECLSQIRRYQYQSAQ